MSESRKGRKTVEVKGHEIAIVATNMRDKDYISLTDIAKYKNPAAPADIIKNWTRSKDTIEFLGLWEQLHNPNFKLVEFDQFKNEAGTNSFILSPQKWIESTGAVGITSKSGRYGGTYAHTDIAFEFASWISAEFKLYLITEYQRLKADENNRLSLDWSVNRTLSKINYRIHTDAIKDHLIPPGISGKHQSIAYASEADVLNVALFGKTAKEWREENPGAKGNIRDAATLEQLLVLANMESFNAELIRRKIPQRQRLLELNQLAVMQLRSLLRNSGIKQLSDDFIPK